MKAVVLAAALLFTGCHCPSALTPRRQALAVDPVAEAGGTTYCTAFYIGGDRWVTANHCTWMGTPATVGGRDVSSWVSDPANDLAVLHVPNTGRVPALPLGDAPTFGDPVHFIGFPGWAGSSHFGVYAGYWGTPGINPITLPDGTKYAVPTVEVTDVMVDGGASGSPMMDADGNVVGVVHASHRGRPYSAVIPVSALRALLHDLR